MGNPLNPEAGGIPYPQDELGMELTHITAAVAWRALPFLHFRYGRRGWLFTLSDAGYLVAIASKPIATYMKQVLWLTRLLAHREMPSWIMEVQLLHLARLGRRRGWAHAGTVADAYEQLADMRRQIVGDDDLRRVGRLFPESLGWEPTWASTGMGVLVASAVVDDKVGLNLQGTPFLRWVESLGGAGLDVGPAIDTVRGAVTGDVRNTVN